MFKQMISKAKQKAVFNIYKVSFLNKGVKLINVSCIFYDPSVRACFPTDIKFGDPTVIYSLTNPFKSEIFNFDKFLSGLNVKGFL